jgi:hypothetical protein
LSLSFVKIFYFFIHINNSIFLIVHFIRILFFSFSSSFFFRKKDAKENMVFCSAKIKCRDGCEATKKRILKATRQQGKKATKKRILFFFD